jgi:hypothetical protein
VAVPRSLEKSGIPGVDYVILSCFMMFLYFIEIYVIYVIILNPVVWVGVYISVCVCVGRSMFSRWVSPKNVVLYNTIQGISYEESHCDRQ